MIVNDLWNLRRVSVTIHKKHKCVPVFGHGGVGKAASYIDYCNVIGKLRLAAPELRVKSDGSDCRTASWVDLQVQSYRNEQTNFSFWSCLPKANQQRNCWCIFPFARGSKVCHECHKSPLEAVCISRLKRTCFHPSKMMDTKWLGYVLSSKILHLIGSTDSWHHENLGPRLKKGQGSGFCL